MAASHVSNSAVYLPPRSPRSARTTYPIPVSPIHRPERFFIRKKQKNERRTTVADLAGASSVGERSRAPEHNPGQGWPKNPKPRHHYARNGAARPWYSLLHFLCEPLLTDHQNAGPRALRIPAFEPDRADAGFVRFDAGKSHRGSARITHNRAVLIEHRCSPCVPPGPAHRFPKRLACMCKIAH